jgi:hypothetical protein
MPLILLLLAIILLPDKVNALPRYAAGYAQSCHLCHVNPAGGGMRNAYGSQFFAGTELASKSMDFSELDKLGSSLHERLDVGLDFRSYYFSEFKPDDPETSLPVSEQNSFFQMQGDLYLRFRLMDGVELVLDKGLRSGYEAWALISGGPMKANLKVGRFLPFFGWRWDDHNFNTRKRMGFSQLDADTGMELEFHPDHWSVSLALSNGQSSEFDTDKGKALTSRVAWNGMLGGLGTTLGANGRLVDRAPGTSTRIGGLFAGLSLGALTWTAEADLRVDGESRGLATAQELAWTLRQGHVLLVSHDSWDPNTAEEGSFESRSRLAWNWTALPVLSAQPGIARYSLDEGASNDSWLTLDLQLHLFM